MAEKRPTKPPRSIKPAAPRKAPSLPKGKPLRRETMEVDMSWLEPDADPAAPENKKTRAPAWPAVQPPPLRGAAARRETLQVRAEWLERDAKEEPAPATRRTVWTESSLLDGVQEGPTEGRQPAKLVGTSRTQRPGAPPKRRPLPPPLPREERATDPPKAGRATKPPGRATKPPAARRTTRPPARATKPPAKKR